MCQAYEGERRFMIACEHRATIKGFAAAKFNLFQSDNPYFFKFEKEAWDHGWRCWQERLLPYALEIEYRDQEKYKEAREASEHFKKTGKLAPELERIVNAEIRRIQSTKTTTTES